MVHPALATALPPVTPLPWQPSAASPTVQSNYYRSATAVALDLWQVAIGLQALGTWQTVKGGAWPGDRNRLRKGMPMVSARTRTAWPARPRNAPLRDPAWHALSQPGRRAYQVLRKMLAQPTVQLPADGKPGTWCFASWLDMRLWQDGIGVVPDRDSDQEPVRIDPSSLRKARELLLWASVASPIALICGWMLKPLCAICGRQRAVTDQFFTGGRYTWPMPMEMARRRDTFPAGRSVCWLSGSLMRASGWRMP